MRYPEASAYLGISKATLARLVKRSAVRCVRPTGRAGRGVPVVFFKSDLDLYLQRNANLARA